MPRTLKEILNKAINFYHKTRAILTMFLNKYLTLTAIERLPSSVASLNFLQL